MKQFFFRVKFVFLTAGRFFLNLIFDQQTCVVCGKNCFLIPLCKSCKTKCFDVKGAVSAERCQICGKELISTEKTCMQCRETAVIHSCDKVLPIFSYRLWNKELLFRWKIMGTRALSYDFARMVKLALEELKIKTIIPVPPRKGKIRKNGWDQIDELCQFLCFMWGFEILPVLQRNSVIQQKKLNRENRLESIKNAYSFVEDKKLFKILKKQNGLLPDKVCILDDVCTTGATLESCACLLKEKNVKTVYALTLFTVD